MSDALLYGMLYFGVIAFVVAVVGVIVQVLFASLAARLGSYLLGSVPVIALGAGALGVALSKRDLEMYQLLGGLGGEASGSVWISRLANLALLAIAVAKLTQMLFAQSGRARAAPLSEAQAANRHLFTAFLIYAVCSLLLPMVFGTDPAFSHDGLIAVPMFAAAYLGRKESINEVLSGARSILLLVVLASLALVAVMPKLVVSKYDGGLIPGLPYRFWGLSAHPNVMGGMTVSLMLMLWLRPFSRRWLQTLAWLVAVAALFLTQSKTSWMAGLLACGTLLTYRHGRNAEGRLHIGVWIVLMFGAALIASGLLFIDVEKIMNRFLDSDVGNGLTTLTGRTKIWQVALNMWFDSPLFGYGPNAWEFAHRVELGVPTATQAHNQFLQALSEGGLAYAISMSVYFVFLGQAALRSAAWTRGVSLATFLVIAIRCTAEAPFAIVNMTSGDMVLHLMLFMMVVNEARGTKKDHSNEAVHRVASSSFTRGLIRV